MNFHNNVKVRFSTHQFISYWTKGDATLTIARPSD